jgi:hypothetical protein
MSYSHYWLWKAPLASTEADAEKFVRWSKDVARLLDFYPDLQPHWAFLGRFPLPETWNITVRGPSGSGEPIFNAEQVAFNGDEATGNACEAFVLQRDHISQPYFVSWCKTGHCPYDLLVIAALVRFAHYFPAVVLTSDGEEAGLDAGAELCRRAFGVGSNPLRDPAYRTYCDAIWPEAFSRAFGQSDVLKERGDV